ncbi:2-dehydro-3-deoxygalactonokinase [Paracoccus sp. (in: a-proteobacteria)]|uniref:2-dehydro-3-deoxygalactonokinase n=1 Tax=Paracoccus sp. TaxID=267 RepID=UPI003A8B1A1D
MSADFVAVDWGTSSFRLWVMGRDGTVAAESRSAEGMQHCAEAGFAPVLDAHLARTKGQGLPVLICGMAGARQGWFEAPYADLPAPVSALAGQAVRLPETLTGGRDIRILPGLAQRDPARPDVMRGEETQLLGLAAGSGAEGLVCMPGTHCKWAHLAGGAVVDFQSFLTGELFDLLSRHSILRHAMPEGGRILPDAPGFLAAVDEALDDPGAVMGQLFPLRAGNLLGFRDAQACFARLSGLLIGAETGRQVASGTDVILVGQAGLGPLYGAALARAGVTIHAADAEQATRQGLVAAAGEIWGWV